MIRPLLDLVKQIQKMPIMFYLKNHDGCILSIIKLIHTPNKRKSIVHRCIPKEYTITTRANMDSFHGMKFAEDEYRRNRSRNLRQTVRVATFCVTRPLRKQLALPLASVNMLKTLLRHIVLTIITVLLR